MTLHTRYIARRTIRYTSRRVSVTNTITTAKTITTTTTTVKVITVPAAEAVRAYNICQYCTESWVKEIKGSKTNKYWFFFGGASWPPIKVYIKWQCQAMTWPIRLQWFSQSIRSWSQWRLLMVRAPLQFVTSTTFKTKSGQSPGSAKSVDQDTLKINGPFNLKWSMVRKFKTCGAQCACPKVFLTSFSMLGCATVVFLRLLCHHPISLFLHHLKNGGTRNWFMYCIGTSTSMLLCTTRN